jgi:hypothetical protein
MAGAPVGAGAVRGTATNRPARPAWQGRGAGPRRRARRTRDAPAWRANKGHADDSP